MKVEGKNAVIELFRSNTAIDKLLIQNNAKKDLENIITLALKKRIRVSYVPKEALDRESTVKNHQGVIAVVNGYSYASLEDILSFAKSKNEEPFILLCDGIADPHNLGSLIRTCECAGVHGIVIPKNRSCQVNETVIKVSTGACFNVKIACVTNLNNCIRWLKERYIYVYSLEANGANIYDVDLTCGLALVVGSEGFGVSALTKKLSDQILSLPMHGKVNSLNASVAGALGVYEVVRQRHGKNTQ
ncbi:MAG TPA: 23S rRNA (guanosine(2251)-2'-O)-methyltransferase RlmB [Clostridiales bacterium]|nr:23S rRNA (guanosine(2251)-2'-O)-methyltransferase RlmB [Clostridiales bacterium]